jgi:hypothetical protein
LARAEVEQLVDAHLRNAAVRRSAPFPEAVEEGALGGLLARGSQNAGTQGTTL